MFTLKQEEKEMIQNFYDTVLRHHSLQYVEMYNMSSEDLKMILKKIANATKTQILKKIVNTTKKQKLPIINVH